MRGYNLLVRPLSAVDLVIFTDIAYPGTSTVHAPAAQRHVRKVDQPRVPSSRANTAVARGPVITERVRDPAASSQNASELAATSNTSQLIQQNLHLKSSISDRKLSPSSEIPLPSMLPSAVTYVPTRPPPHSSIPNPLRIAHPSTSPPPLSWESQNARSPSRGISAHSIHSSAAPSHWSIAILGCTPSSFLSQTLISAPGVLFDRLPKVTGATCRLITFHRVLVVPNLALFLPITVLSKYYQILSDIISPHK
ncbi:hypothetical protein A0H81_03564 [Grifola frondosa]|uniref:Uncharacterized protein n=1 Tax=Grifola frondosa TaxID=5627 RepID=A0A1C7MJK7_GRIFR|nr:hypothetical protein A0H81_03564 [Grifola frondosa]